MNKFLALTKVLLKSSTAFQGSDSRRRNFSLLIIIATMLPMIVISTIFLMKTYDILKAVNIENVILAALLSAACLTMIIFGILYVISIYYFSDNTIQLITMPLKPHLILASKFVIVIMYQYFLELVILLPGILAFGIKNGSIAYWFYSIIIFLVLPVIPTVICSVISLFIMTFGRFFQNKDRVKFAAGFLAIALAIGINIGIQAIGINSVPGGNFLINNKDLMRKSVMLFPTNMIAVNAILDASVLKGLMMLIIFILISTAALAIFLILSNELYLSGVVGLTQSTIKDKKLSKEQFEKRSKKRPKVLTLAMKEWRILYRTPAYFLNCILSAVIFPPLIIIALGISADKSIPLLSANPITISIAVIIISFLCLMNMISSTAISRDGKNFYVSKYMPVPYRTQIIAKLLPGLVISSFTLLLTMVLSLFMIKFEYSVLIPVFGLCLISLTAFNMLGLFIDIIFPKLDWDDETAAVKRNINVGIQLIMMLLVLSIPAYFAYLLKMSLNIGIVFLLIANLIILAAAAVLLFKKGAAIYSGIAEAPAAIEKKYKSYKKIISGAVTFILAASFAGFMIFEFTISANVEVNSTKVDISAGFMESYSFNLSKIKDVYLKNSMPSTSNKLGFASGNRLRGTFTVAGIGRGHVYTETANGPFLYVILKDKSFIIFNFSDSGKTKKLYKELKTKVIKNILLQHRHIIGEGIFKGITD